MTKDELVEEMRRRHKEWVYQGMMLTEYTAEAVEVMFEIVAKHLVQHDKDKTK